MALRGLKVLELSGLAPSPFCGLILSNLGAKVIKVNRFGDHLSNKNLFRGGKHNITLNMKNEIGLNIIKQLSRDSDVLIEPYLPGTMEKMGLGPDHLMENNPGLIYARMTGYGQTGPYSRKAGHSINFMAISGILDEAIKLRIPPEDPVMLSTMFADFAAGSMNCAMGIMAALLEKSRTGRGQVIDSNMTEGISYIGTFAHEMTKLMEWENKEIFYEGSHFYGVYPTKDGKMISVGAMEPQFYDNLTKKLGLDGVEARDAFKTSDKMKGLFAAKFKEKTRDEWIEIFSDVEACITPVLTLDEAIEFEHNRKRGSFFWDDKVSIHKPVICSTPFLSFGFSSKFFFHLDSGPENVESS